MNNSQKRELVERRQKYYQTNRRKIMERTNLYYRKNVVKIRQRAKDYRMNNIDKIKVANKKYRQKNFSRIRKLQRERYKASYQPIFSFCCICSTRFKKQGKQKTCSDACSRENRKRTDRIYIFKNRDRCNRNSSRSYWRNRDKILHRQKEFRRKNKKLCYESSKRWRDRNKFKVKMLNRKHGKRRAMLVSFAKKILEQTGVSL